MPEEDEPAGGVNPVETPPIGARVELRGLQSKPELNGRCGTVLSWDADKGRAGVKIGNRTLSLKPTNLTTVNEDESATFECAICWADVEGSPAELPCCGAPPPGSSTCYCERCIEIICEQALGGMGRWDRGHASGMDRGAAWVRRHGPLGQRRRKRRGRWAQRT